MQLLNIVKGGISGLANHISDTSGNINREM